MEKNTAIWVYDKETDELFTNGFPYDYILSNKFGGNDIPSNVSGSTEFNDFIFLTEGDVKDIVKNHYRVGNPLVDNINFQTKYEFNKEPLTKQKLKFRMDLLKEEYEETLAAYEASDSEEFVDGLIDLVVISLGTLYLADVKVGKAWREVFRANMSKVRGVKPGREQSGGFDVIKPEGWVGPDHSTNHGRLPTIFKQK